MIEHVLVPKTVRALSLSVIQFEGSCTLWKTEQVDWIDEETHRDTLVNCLSTGLEEERILAIDLNQDLAIRVLYDSEWWELNLNVKRVLSRHDWLR